MCMNRAVWLSNHEGKMEGIQSLSTPCSINTRCKRNAEIEGSICSKCYAMQLLSYRHSTEEHLIDNFQLLNDHILTAAEMPIINAAFFRIEAFGDVASVTQAANYIEIIRFNKWCNFAVFTKNPDLYKAAFKDHPKPSNMIFVVSSLFINKESAAWKAFPEVDIIFTCYEAEYAIEHNIKINCGSADCLGCRNCYTVQPGLRFVNEIVKDQQKLYYKLLKKQQQQ